MSEELKNIAQEMYEPETEEIHTEEQKRAAFIAGLNELQEKYGYRLEIVHVPQIQVAKITNG